MPPPTGRPPINHVLMVTYEYPPLGGGGGVICKGLAEELSKQVDVTVLTSGRVDLPQEERRGRLHLVRVPVLLRQATAVASLPSMLSFFPSSLRAGRRLLRLRHPDVVHTAFAVPSGPSGLLLARRARVPHVLSILGGDIYDPSKWFSPHRTPLLKQTVRWVIHGSDRVVADSADIAQRAKQLYAARDVDCVPLAVNPLRVDPAARAEFGIAAEDLVLITVGRLVARKQVQQLLAVLDAAGDARLHLVVIGEGPMGDTWGEEAQSRGLADRVHWMGFVTEERKWRLLGMADLYVSTSAHEGFGIALLEGMASGLPVVCYDEGGHTDFLTPEAGHLVPLNDMARFRDALAQLSAAPERVAAMGAAAKRIAREYHLDRYAARYMEVYRECADGVPATPTEVTP